MSILRIGNVFCADTARVVGDVELGDDVNLWYGAAIRGDVARVEIGEKTNVQDNAVIHCDFGAPNIIGRRVSIGHGAIVHGIKIGDGSLIGMGSVVLGGSVIGERCIIAAGAVVTEGMEVVDDMVVMGVPGKVVRGTTAEEKAYMAELSDRYVRLAMKHVSGGFGSARREIV